jgi:hypothetical protein
VRRINGVGIDKAPEVDSTIGSDDELEIILEYCLAPNLLGFCIQSGSRRGLGLSPNFLRIAAVETCDLPVLRLDTSSDLCRDADFRETMGRSNRNDRATVHSDFCVSRNEDMLWIMIFHQVNNVHMRVIW